MVVEEKLKGIVLKNQGHFLLDEIDKQILRKLQQDGTLSLRTLASEIGVSVSTIKNHFDTLHENGIIKKTMAIVDCTKIGYKDMLIFNARVNNTRSIADIITDIEKIDRIKFLYQISGAYPILGMAKCLDREEQISLVEDLKKIPGIEEIIPQVVLRKAKEDFTLYIP